MAYVSLWPTLSNVFSPAKRKSKGVIVIYTVLLGCVASWPVIGWRLPRTDQRLAWRRPRSRPPRQLFFQTHACETGPIYHQRQAGTVRSNVAACEVKMVNAQNAVSLAIGCSIAAAAAVCSEFSEGRARTAIPDVTDRYVRSWGQTS